MTRKLRARNALLLAGLFSSLVHPGILCQMSSGPGSLFVSGDASADIPREDIQTKAAAGHLREELRLACDYLAGRGVPRDLSKAAYWYQKAANQGDTGAEVQMGYFYLA